MNWYSIHELAMIKEMEIRKEAELWAKIRERKGDGSGEPKRKPVEVRIQVWGLKWPFVSVRRYEPCN